MKMKLIMESFKRSLNENFPEMVSTKEYTKNGKRYREDINDDGSISTFEWSDYDDAWEFVAAHKSEAHREAVKYQSNVEELLDQGIEGINQAEVLIQSMAESGDEAMQIAAKALMDEVEQRISALETDQKTLQGFIDQYSGGDIGYGYGEEDELEASQRVSSGESAKELEDIGSALAALRNIQ